MESSKEEPPLRKKVKGYWLQYRSVPLEALFIVLFSQLPILLASFLSRASADEDQLARASFFTEIISRYSTSDVFIFATGVLGSAIVYFVLRIKLIENKTRIIFTGIVIPLMVIFLTALISATLELTDGEPNSFVQTYSIWMLVVLVLSWLFALFEQRNIIERKTDVPDEERRKEMMSGAQGKIR